METYLIAGIVVFGLLLAVRALWKALLRDPASNSEQNSQSNGRNSKSGSSRGRGQRRGTGRSARPKFGMNELARRMGVSVEELRTFSPSYHSVSIPKRSGGTRKLTVPDERTKQLQRRLLRRILQRLNSHPAAFGFERQRSIVDHAQLHTGQVAVVRMDIVDFFPTTRSNAIEAFFRRLGWDAEAVKFLVKLTTHRGGLPQGAATSPRLSNLVNHILDRRLTGLAKKFNATYSRYADDITFSFSSKQIVPPTQSHRYPRRLNLNSRVDAVILTTETILKSMGYELHRDRKLSVAMASTQQRVTGLVVNEKVALPRHRRRWLRAVQHRFEQNREATITRNQLQGWLAFEQMVNRNRRNSVTTPTESQSPREKTSSISVPSESTPSSFTTLIDSIESTPRLGPERQETVAAAIGRLFQLEMTVDREYQGLGLNAPPHLQGGVAILARSESSRQVVELQFGPTSASHGKSMRRGDGLNAEARFLTWDETFDRAIFEFIA